MIINKIYNMSNIEIFKQDLFENEQKVGTLTIIRGIFPKDVKESDIKQIMQGVINNYVGHRPHSMFVKENNSQIYVIIEGMGELTFWKYDQPC